MSKEGQLDREVPLSVALIAEDPNEASEPGLEREQMLSSLHSRMFGAKEEPVPWTVRSRSTARRVGPWVWSTKRETLAPEQAAGLIADTAYGLARTVTKQDDIAKAKRLMQEARAGFDTGGTHKHRVAAIDA